MGEVPLPPEEPGKLGGRASLSVPAPARAVNRDGRASCQGTVTVQFPDPHVSGLSVKEPRLRGWDRDKHGELKTLQPGSLEDGAGVPEYSLVVAIVAWPCL